MNYRWERINNDWVAIPTNEVKPTCYIDGLIELLGKEVVYEVFYGLPRLERETIENQELP